MKQSRRQRAKSSHNGSARHKVRHESDDPEQVTGTTALLREVVQRPSWSWGREELLSSFLAEQPQRQRRSLAVVSAEVVEGVFDRRWTPHDIAEHLRRGGDDTNTGWALGLVAARTAAYPADRVHPQWLAGLDSAPTPIASILQDADIRAVIGLLNLLAQLPTVARVLPRPGEEVSPVLSPESADPKMLRRIRALLAKAESTEFEAEAEALTAKAQALMTRYSITHIPADDDHRVRPPDVRRIWIDRPYVVPKSVLVGQVARANRCRSLIHDRDGYVTVIGFAADLELVELLVTSLLVQSGRAMHEAGSQVGYYGESRTKSFRRSFLLAYAYRVGERLRASTDEVTAHVDEQCGGALVPVLANRGIAVQTAFDAMFPGTSKLRPTVSNRSGYGAGRAAADHARLDVRRSVHGAASA